MAQTRFPKITAVSTAFAAIILAGMLISSKRVGARVDEPEPERGIQDSPRF